MSKVDFVVWSDQYSVGVPAMDAQHKKLIALLNQVYDAIQRGRTSRVVKDVVSELIRYADTHFRDEEHLMRKHRFPDLEVHQWTHKEFARKAHDLSEKAGKDSAEMAFELLRFLKDWLVHHICAMDKEYGPYMKK